MNPEDESIAAMKKIDYEKFLEETKATMMVTGCRSYMAAKEESKCQGYWFFFVKVQPKIIFQMIGEKL